MRSIAAFWRIVDRCNYVVQDRMLTFASCRRFVRAESHLDLESVGDLYGMSKLELAPESLFSRCHLFLE